MRPSQCCAQQVCSCAWLIPGIILRGFVWVSLLSQDTLAPAGAVEEVRLATFFKSYRRTALHSGDLIINLHVPLPVDGCCLWFKQSRRIDDDISIVNACVVTKVDANNKGPQTPFVVCS